MDINLRSVEETVHRFIASKKLLQKGDTVLAAVSGGADSIFLIHFLKKFEQRYRISVKAFHLNHMLRSSAGGDEFLCSLTCEKLNIDYCIVRTDVREYAEKKKLSIETAGREIRYRELKNAAKRYQCNKIVTAHHMDDNAETLLFRFIRGTGPAGLAGIPSQNGEIIRPLLGLTKEDIVTYLNMSNIRYAVDETNFLPEYSRNFIRINLIPQITGFLNSAFSKTVSNNAALFSELNEYLVLQAEIFIMEFVEDGEDSVKINNCIMEKPVFIQQLILRQLLGRVQPEREIPFNVIHSMTNIIAGSRSRELRLGKQLIFRKDEACFTLVRHYPKYEAIDCRMGIGNYETPVGLYSLIKVPERGTNGDSDPFNEYIQLSNSEPIITLRYWKRGDKMVPFGMKGSKKVSDILNEMNIPPDEKKTYPVFEYDGLIIWIPGYRISESCRVTEGANNIFQIKLKR